MRHLPDTCALIRFFEGSERIPRHGSHLRRSPHQGPPFDFAQGRHRQPARSRRRLDAEWKPSLECRANRQCRWMVRAGDTGSKELAHGAGKD